MRDLLTILCSRCAQLCDADSPPCHCGAAATMMVPTCNRCGGTDNASRDLRALAVQLAEALARQIAWNEKPRIDFHDGDNDSFESDLYDAQESLSTARNAGLIK